MKLDPKQVFARIAARISGAKTARRRPLRAVLPTVADCSLESRLMLSASSDDDITGGGGNTNTGGDSNTGSTSGDSNTGSTSGDSNTGSTGGDSNTGSTGGDSNTGSTSGDSVGDEITGWSITGPGGTVYLDLIAGDVVVSGARGTNPNGKTIRLEIWDNNNNTTSSPWMTVTILDNPNPSSTTWSVNIGRTAGSFTAELHWDGIIFEMFGDPRSLSFDVENGDGGDPTP